MHEPQARRALSALSGDGEPELRPSPPMVRRAFELARDLDHPVYDCVYLAPAQELDLPLVTADERLAAVVATTGDDRVRLLNA